MSARSLRARLEALEPDRPIYTGPTEQDIALYELIARHGVRLGEQPQPTSEQMREYLVQAEAVNAEVLRRLRAGEPGADPYAVRADLYPQHAHQEDQ
ncbi:hypothetical protein ACFCX4_08955 [Kitasatospora sp. NPDC056327]|uniref:hypothetical protein n=1 Tax=Kitasatospora sp. NPDC056327 TaxID=3345785 RepID=UPI0035DE2DF1